MLSIACFGIICIDDDILLGVNKRKNTTEVLIGGKLNQVDFRYLSTLINQHVKGDKSIFDVYFNTICPMIEKMNQTKFNEPTIYKHKIDLNDEKFITELLNSDGKSPFFKCTRLLECLILKRELWEEVGGLYISIESLYNSKSHHFPDNVPYRFVSVFRIENITIAELEMLDHGINLLKSYSVDVPIDYLALIEHDVLVEWLYEKSQILKSYVYTFNVDETDVDIPPIRDFSIPYLKHFFPKIKNSENSEESTSTNSDVAEIIDDMKKLTMN